MVRQREDFQEKATLDLMRQMLADDTGRDAVDDDTPRLAPLGTDDAVARMEEALGPAKGTVLIACGLGFFAHLDEGGDRSGACLAVPRFLAAQGMTPLPLPCLNGVEAIRRAEPGGSWLTAFLGGMARQAEEGEVAPRAASLPHPAASPKEAPPMSPEPDRWVEPAEGVDDALANLERILKRQDPLLARYGRPGNQTNG